jgi:CHAT domain-containing protein
MLAPRIWKAAKGITLDRGCRNKDVSATIWPRTARGTGSVTSAATAASTATTHARIIHCSAIGTLLESKTPENSLVNGARKESRTAGASVSLICEFVRMGREVNVRVGSPSSRF